VALPGEAFRTGAMEQVELPLYGVLRSSLAPSTPLGL
jgi:hypothetical protein